MRLTLRTLLAYMDDILDPADKTLFGVQPADLAVDTMPTGLFGARRQVLSPRIQRGDGRRVESTAQYREAVRTKLIDVTVVDAFHRQELIAHLLRLLLELREFLLSGATLGAFVGFEWKGRDAAPQFAPAPVLILAVFTGQEAA